MAPSAYAPLIQQLRLALANHDPLLLRSLFHDPLDIPSDAAQVFVLWGDIGAPGIDVHRVAATPGTLDSFLACPPLILDAIVYAEYVGPIYPLPLLRL